MYVIPFTLKEGEKKMIRANLLITTILILHVFTLAHAVENTNINPSECTIALSNNEEELSIYFEAIARYDHKTLLTLNNANWDTKTKHENGRVLLHYAALLGKFTSISTLVNEVGIDINTRDENNWTVLHYAVLKRMSHVSVKLSRA